MRGLRSHPGHILGSGPHLHHPTELLGGAVMLVGAVTTVTTAVVDASSIAARVHGGDVANRSLWLGSFAVAIATLVLGALAHSGHPASRSIGSRTAYAVGALLNATVAVTVTMPTGLPAVLSLQQLLAALLLASLALVAQPA